MYFKPSNLWNIRKLSEIFNVSIDYLLGRINKETPNSLDIDGKTLELLKEVGNRSEIKELLRSCKNANKEQILHAAKLLESISKNFDN